MSLSALTSPPVIGALTAGCYASMPFIQGWFQQADWMVVKGANLAAYGLSFWAVSQPGRYDSQAKISGNPTNPAKATDMDRMGTGRYGRTLVPPAGWAFAIWGPIFIGEFVMVASQAALMNETDSMAPLIRSIAGPHVLAQCFQSLWTASFRPQYNQGYWKYLSALNLAGIALSLSQCHGVYASTDNDISTKDYLLNFLPLTMHFGWTSAAALVNLNGMFALGEKVTARQVTAMGHASVVAATTLGVSVTLARNAPVYGGVIAWALAAVSAGIAQRIEATQGSDPKAIGVLGTKPQRYLSLAGAVLCATSSLYVALAEK